MSFFEAPDSNVWYQITESLLGFNNSLQYNGYTIYMGSTSPATNQFWQFFPSDNGTYQIREKATTEQLTACYTASETAVGKTRPCMMPTTNDTTQEWELSQWSDGTYKITNVANGTGYNMDCHPGNTLYMSPNITATPSEPGQHWEIKALGDINDGTFSTAFPVAITPTSSSSSISVSATSTSLFTGSSNAPKTTGTNPSLPLQAKQAHNLSTGAVIGFTLAIALLVCSLAVLSFFFYRRQRNHQNQLPTSELQADDGFKGGWRMGLQEAPAADPSELYSPPAELSHNTAPQDFQDQQPFTPHIYQQPTAYSSSPSSGTTVVEGRPFDSPNLVHPGHS